MVAAILATVLVLAGLGLRAHGNPLRQENQRRYVEAVHAPEVGPDDLLAIRAAVTAEATPPGRSLVLRCRPLPDRRALKLAHSGLYADADIIRSIVEHIRAARGVDPAAGRTHGGHGE